MDRSGNLLRTSYCSCLLAFALAFATGVVIAAEPQQPGDETLITGNQGVEIVKLHTNYGEITIELLNDDAPVTTANFMAYVTSGFFDDTIFHRVIPGFVIQGGGFTADMIQKKTGAPIINESGNGLKNQRGTLSMARTNDPHSATSQFFINLRDNPSLDAGIGRPGYAVFARVIEGMDVVDKIAMVKTGAFGMHRDVPAKPVIVEKVECVNTGSGDSMQDASKD